MKKIIFLFLICAFIQNNVFAQLIHINTQENSLIFQITKHKKVVQSHYGTLIKNTQGLENMTVVFNEAYPSFGNGMNDEVALMATHDDGTMATDLFYVSHQQKKEGNIKTTVSAKGHARTHLQQRLSGAMVVRKQ